jgi:hypothetical protein
MAVLTVNQITRAGLTDTLAAANVGGDLLPNTGKEWIEVNNGSGGSINVLISGYVDGQAITVQTIAVGASARKKIGPFPPHLYNNPSGQVAIGYSAVTTVTVAAFQLGTS